jgi:hypothetical protein
MTKSAVLPLIVGALALHPPFRAEVPADLPEHREVLNEEQQRLRDAAHRRLEDADSERTRFYSLAKVAKLSCEEGDYDSAERYAIEVLQLARSFPEDWNYGNALHDGNMVLGRVALVRGNLAEAKRRLLEAGQTPGSPQLATFGPNVSLADDLLGVGESEVVLEYFAQCSGFWKHGLDDLARWSNVVRQGGRPEFGPNLVY